MVSAIIVAGGQGRRMGAGKNKVFLKLLGTEIIVRAAAAFEENEHIDEIIIVTSKDDICECKKITKQNKKLAAVVLGGEERRDSVYNGIKAAKGDIVLIHDAARCLVSQEIIDNVIADCMRYGAAAPGISPKDTIKAADENGFIAGTIDREKTCLIQTPQAFYREVIKKAHEAAKDVSVTDDCALA